MEVEPIFIPATKRLRPGYSSLINLNIFRSIIREQGRPPARNTAITPSEEFIQNTARQAGSLLQRATTEEDLDQVSYMFSIAFYVAQSVNLPLQDTMSAAYTGLALSRSKST